MDFWISIQKVLFLNLSLNLKKIYISLVIIFRKVVKV